MTIEQYNRITELAKEGKTGIEIVNTINEENKQTPEPKQEPEPDPEPNPEPEPNPLLEKLEALEQKLSTMQETIHAVNIMNSSQPEAQVKGSKDILAECFAGYTEAKEN